MELDRDLDQDRVHSIPILKVQILIVGISLGISLGRLDTLSEFTATFEVLALGFRRWTHIIGGL